MYQALFKCFVLISLNSFKPSQQCYEVGTVTVPTFGDEEAEADIIQLTQSHLVHEFVFLTTLI